MSFGLLSGKTGPWPAHARLGATHWRLHAAVCVPCAVRRECKQGIERQEQRPLPSAHSLEEPPLRPRGDPLSPPTPLLHLPTASSSTPAVAPALGPDLWNKTYYPRAGDVSKDTKRWWVIDAEGQTLGRLAVLAATLIRGKDSPAYTPSCNTGAYVVVINAEKVTVSGNKTDAKMYYRHSGRPGGLKSETFRQLQARIPERIIEKAVKGMLPSSKIGNELFRQLKVYAGPDHPHSAQAPVDATARIGLSPKKAAAAGLAK